MVKFGHQLQQEAQKMHDVLATLDGRTDVMNYKQFKKFLKVSMAHMGDPVDIVSQQVQTELTDEFWQRMEITGSNDAFSASAWFSELLESCIRQEVSRIHAVIEEFQFQIISCKKVLGGVQKNVSQSAHPVDDLYKLDKLWHDIVRWEEGMHHFRIMNLIGFSKILKKFDKNWSSVTGLKCTQTLMPFVLERLSHPAGTTGMISQVSEINWDEYLDKAHIQMVGKASDNPAIRKQLSLIQVINKKQLSELMDVADKDGDGSSVSSVLTVHTRNESQTHLFWSSLPAWLPPLASAIKGYSWQSLRTDFVASLVISIAGIPKAMAYAKLAGLPATAGIATLYVPNLIYALLSGSRQGATSPQSVPALLLGQMVTEALEHNGLEDQVEHRMALTMAYTFLTGAVLMLIGCFKITFLLSFISKPVLSGFMSASVIVAAVSTFKGFLRVSVTKSPVIHETLSSLFAKLPEADLGTLFISASAISSMILLGYLQKWVKKRLAGRHGWWFVLKEIARLPVAIWVVLAGILLGGSFCDFHAFTAWEPVHKVVGRGATFPADALNSVGHSFECSHYKDRVLMEYVPTGSGDGLRSMLTNSTLGADFATSDIRPADSVLAEFGTLAYPVVSNLVCPVVNIPLIPESHQIRLIVDLPTLAGIFSGSHQTWNDPRIKSLNPNLPWDTLDSAPIKVVVRSDDSGTTSSFSKILSECEGCNGNASITPGMQVQWQAKIWRRVSSNEEVVNEVAKEAWSIGYATLNEVKQAEAKGTGVACVALQMQEQVITTAWSSWPFMLTNYLLVPAMHDRTVDSSPRQTGCGARKWLHSYVEMLYSMSHRLEPQAGMMFSQPHDIDLILCPGDRQNTGHRRLLGSHPKCDSSITAAKCKGFKMVGYVPAALPSYQMPSFSLLPFSANTCLNVLWLSIVALLEHVAVVKKFSDDRGYAVSIPNDTLAVGLANVFGSIFGSFFVAAGLSRSSLNSEAETQVSLILSVLLCLGLVYLIAPLLSMLPEAFLSVVLFMAVIGTVDWRTVLELRKLGRYGYFDLAALLLAFSTTCLLGVIPGMSLAVGFSIILFILNSSFSQVVHLGRVPGTARYEVFAENSTSSCTLSGRGGRGITHNSHIVSLPDVKVLSPRAPLWFGNVARFIDILGSELRQTSLSAVVIDMSHVAWIDATACAELNKVLLAAKNMERHICFAQANTEVRQVILAGCGACRAKLFFESILEAEIGMGEGQFSDASKFETKDSADEADDAVIDLAERAAPQDKLRRRTHTEDEISDQHEVQSLGDMATHQDSRDGLRRLAWTP
eukprot:TRINITY_DN26337_c0_g1_i1.p1 TRINITY_DN26337_c0_g1~~TRINITY_DN26337_c0_g1_i1.p1  ORF type:complete len:1297 (+),score=197.92 TRINITY_DN26337_c0_g1_i1:123-4013(+)